MIVEMDSYEFTGQPPVIIGFKKLLSDRSRLIVPVYQRDFVWDKKNAEELTRDLDTVLRGEYESRFLGTIVLNFDETAGTNDGSEFHIIDGQQRITCLFLLVISILKELKKLDSEFDETLKDSEIIRKHNSLKDKGMIKLQPRRGDRKAFNNCLKELNLGDEKSQTIFLKDVGQDHWRPNALTPENEVEEQSQIEKIAEYFDEYVAEKIGSGPNGIENYSEDQQRKELEKLYLAVSERLLFSSFTIDKSLDPHEVFERLNFSGVDLTQYDLVRNLLLMNLSKGRTDRTNYLDKIYDTYLDEFESYWVADKKAATSEGGRSKLRKKYTFALAQIRDSSSSKSGTFNALKDYYHDNYFKGQVIQNSNLSDRNKKEKEIFADLKEFHFTFNALARGTYDGHVIEDPKKDLWKELQIEDPQKASQINKWVGQYKLLGKAIDDSTFPYIVQLFDSLIQGPTDYDEGILCLKTLESFLVRRNVLGEGRKGLDLFRGLWENSSGVSNHERLIAAIKADSDASFISDEDFRNFIEGERKGSEKGVYGRPIARYVVWHYDLLFRAEDEEQLPNKRVTMDHVIPRGIQNRKTKDVDLDELALWGKDWNEQTYLLWRDKWANLVPLSAKLNAKKGAKDFTEAKNLFKKSKKAKYATANEVFVEGKYGNWALDNVEQRAKDIADKAIVRWPLPVEPENVLDIGMYEDPPEWESD